MNQKHLLWLLAGISLVFGCSKTARQDETPGAEEAVLELTENPQGVFVIDGSLSEFKDGKMQWKANMYAGDTVGWTGEKMEAVRAYDGATRTFYRVEANGEYWVHDYYIAGPAVPAVICSAETVLYTRPDPGSVARTGTVTLPKYTIVAMLPDDNYTDDFIPVAAFVNLGQPGERWVKIKNISWDPNDVNAVKITRAAAVVKNPVSHKELLENAIKMIAESSSFNNMQNDPALFELEVTNNLELLTEWKDYTVISDWVNVRELPTINSNAAGRLNRGDIVMITAASKEVITLESAGEGTEKVSGIWLRTDQGTWVFSAYVIPYPAAQ
ncbi:MAG: hypothetical protein FWG27_06665 [Treponema sp.]|nr:hypothetical protein [Treponema sp.]